MNPASEAMLDAPRLGKRVARNAAWLLAGRVASQGLAMLFAIVVARRLGEAGLGQYAFITSVILLGNLSTTFGTDMLIIRELAAKRDFSLLPAALVVQLALSVAFIALVFLLTPLIPNQDAQTLFAVKLYSLALLPLAFYSVFSSALRGLERMDAFTWLNAASSAILLALGLALVRPDSSVVTLAAVLLAGQAAGAVLAGLLWARAAPAGGRAWSIARRVVLRLLRLSAPIAVLAILGALYQRSAIYLLSTAQGAEQTGLFSAALRLVEAAKIGQIAVLSALFPAMAQAGQLSNSRARAQFQKVFTSSALGLFALTALIAVALGLLAQPIIELLYGADFAPASAVLRPLAWVLAPMTISHYLSLQLLARNGEKPIMLALLLSIIAFVAAFSPAITRFGLPGVAWAMLAAEGLQAGVLALAWRKVRA